MTYGYARVSSTGQQLYGNSLEAQEKTLRDNGAEIIYKEAFTGTKSHRPELDKLLTVLRDGDTLVVVKLDRIARSVKSGIELIESLASKGVTVNVLNMGKLDNTPSGKLMRTVMLAFAEFERDMIVERTREGKEIARMNPDYKEGRKSVEYDAELFDMLYADVMDGSMSVVEAAERLGISRGKWYRIVKERTAAPAKETAVPA